MKMKKLNSFINTTVEILKIPFDFYIENTVYL